MGDVLTEIKRVFLQNKYKKVFGPELGIEPTSSTERKE